jgi:hypothetical protein
MRFLVYVPRRRLLTGILVVGAVCSPRHRFAVVGAGAGRLLRARSTSVESIAVRNRYEAVLEELQDPR